MSAPAPRPIVEIKFGSHLYNNDAIGDTYCEVYFVSLDLETAGQVCPGYSVWAQP